MARLVGISSRFSRRALCFILVSALILPRLLADVPPTERNSVQLMGKVQENPPQIALSWVGDSQATSYEVFRRTMDSGWQSVATLGGSETSWTDSGINAQTRYEYKMIKRTGAGYTGYGYLASGIRLPAQDNWGKLILLVENSLAGPLSTELAQLQSDLTGEGWTVIRRDVSMNDSPAAVKELIRGIYNSDPAGVKALFLFGHIPVPYSGNINPDGHPNHQGAWPADVYYADMDGTWTDSEVRTTSAERDVNWNVPGDGRFDQSVLPSDAELMVGRVDLYNMTCYANKTPSRSEIDLMRQYINKDHAFRFGQLDVQKRGIMCDNFADKGSDPISGSAWRSWPGFFGAQNIVKVPWDGYLPATTSGSYLWSYASGGGSYYYSMGVAGSDDFALNDVKVVFTMFLGSYFGDWNNESNFLRAALGSGYVLTATYTGAPHYIYFPMAMGQPIGYCVRLTQNNATNGLYEPWVQGTSQVHISLMGDPTLRLSPVKPVSNLKAAASPGAVTLTWNASADISLLGYYIYRSSAAEGPYERLVSSPVPDLVYIDTPPAGRYYYMVRAIKLEQNDSGSYLNPSQGQFAQATVTPPVVQPPDAPTLQVTGITFSTIDLKWNSVSNATAYKVEINNGGNWSEIVTLQPEQTSYTVQGLQPTTSYSFRVRAFSNNVPSDYSPIITVTTGRPPGAESVVNFLRADSTTGGFWPAVSGSGGRATPVGMNNIPQSIHVWTSGSGAVIWQTNSLDARALLQDVTSTTGVAAAWVGTPLTLNLEIAASQPTVVALYFLDWNRTGLAQQITAYDTATQQPLDAREISNFGNGIYLLYSIQGNVLFLFSPQNGSDAVLSGVFFGAPVPTPVSDKPLMLSLHPAASGGFLLSVAGDPGQRFKVQASSNFTGWVDLSAGVLTNSTATVPVNPPPGPQLYLRTVNTR